MDISVSLNLLEGPFGKHVNALKSTHDRAADGPFGKKVSEMAHARNEARKYEATANASNDVELSFSEGDNPQKLVYQASVQNINQAFEEAGLEPIQTTPSGEITDTSPEATATRIVAQSTSRFDAYFAQAQSNNAELTPEEALSNFVQLLTNAIDAGFQEAKNLLSGVIEQDSTIGDSIDATYQAFLSQLSEFNPNEPTTEPVPVEEVLTETL